MHEKKTIYYLLIPLVVFFLYGNTLFNDYSLDDELVIRDNLKIHQGIKGIPEILTTHYSSIGDIRFEYRPVVLITFALEYSLWGENPFYSHLINIILYIILLFVIFKVLQLSFKDYSILFIFLILLLYATHPIHTEVVASLKNRDELLSSLFGFLFIYYILIFLDKQKIIFVVSALIFLFLGVLSKKSAFIFPLILMLFLYFFYKLSLKRILVISILSLISILFFYFLTKHFLISEKADRPMSFFENPLSEYKGLLFYLFTSLYSIFFYIQLALFPNKLLFYYGYDMIPVTDKVSWSIIGMIIIFFLLLWIAIKGIRKKTKLSFGILFFLLAISIYTNLLKKVPGIVGVRFLHVAILGYAVILVVLLIQFFKVDTMASFFNFKKHRLLIILLSSIVSLYSFKTIDENFYWKDRLSLFEQDIEYLNRSAKANNLIGNEYLIEAEKLLKTDNKAKAYEFAWKAKKYLLRSVRIYPNYNKSKSNLGFLYLNYFGKPDSAYFYFNQVHSVKKKKVLSLFSMANEMIRKNDTAMAIRFFSEILHTDSTFLDAYTPLSKIYFKQGNLDKAIALNQILIRKHLGKDLPYINIANFYYLSGDTTLGFAYAELALKENPNNVKVCNKLSKYYYQKGNNKKGNYYLMMAKKAEEKDSIFRTIVEKK